MIKVYSVLEIAEENGCKSIAFPAISTGIYGYPQDKAARTSIATIKEYFKEKEDSIIGEVILVSFDEKTKALYDAFL